MTAVYILDSECNLKLMTFILIITIIPRCEGDKVLLYACAEPFPHAISHSINLYYGHAYHCI